MRGNTPELQTLQFDFKPLLPTIRSRRAAFVARAFGVTPKSAPVESTSFDCDALKWIDALLPAPGKIVLITGASGAGKSSLLRAMKYAAKARWIDLAKFRPANRPIVDCFGRRSLMRVLQSLSQVGLAEVWTYLRTPGELSDGQRWRLRLAMALMKSPRMCPSILGCDEFAALLDRVSAAVVARTLHRMISTSTTMSAIVATSHDDLIAALDPDTIVRCDFGFVEVEKC